MRKTGASPSKNPRPSRDRPHRIMRYANITYSPIVARMISVP
jgi:hypothetical protein